MAVISTHPTVKAMLYMFNHINKFFFVAIGMLSLM